MEVMQLKFIAYRKDTKVLQLPLYSSPKYLTKEIELFANDFWKNLKIDLGYKNLSKVIIALYHSKLSANSLTIITQFSDHHHTIL